jgi:hypothetical protein
VVTVGWYNTHEDCNPRAHWDTALLQDLFAGKVWHPSGFPDFWNLDGLPVAGGAVVMLPGNFHRGDVAEFNAAISVLDWVLIIITSDEDSSFPWDRI